MFNTIQLILVFLTLDVWLPGNVDDMLRKMKETLEMGAGDVAKSFKIEIDARKILTPMEMLVYIGVPVMLLTVVLLTILIGQAPKICKDPV
jgi:hypothetical protein